MGIIYVSLYNIMNISQNRGYNNMETIINIWRLWIMTKNASAMFKGIGTGMAAGIMVGLVSSALMKDNKKSKNMAAKAMDAIEDALDRMQSIFN